MYLLFFTAAGHQTKAGRSAMKPDHTLTGQVGTRRVYIAGSLPLGNQTTDQPTTNHHQHPHTHTPTHPQPRGSPELLPEHAERVEDVASPDMAFHDTGIYIYVI